jgi:predicted ATP-grasp superfamily ATP-dependent carboligase
MTLKDTIKYFLAKILFRKTILFSYHKGRKWNIIKRIKGYVPFFYELDEVNLNFHNLIVPLTLHAQEFINSHPELFVKKTYLCPSEHCIDLCNNKESFHHYLSNNGFQQYSPRINEKFSYPYVVKSKTGDCGDEISIITDKEDEMEHIDKIKSEDYFTSEYIIGQDEYAAQIISADNRIVFFRALKYSFEDEYNVKGFELTPASTEFVDHIHYKPIFEEILSSMNYQGLCCFDYKISEDGLKIMELNPRYGGWMDCFINEALIDYSFNGSPKQKNQWSNKRPFDYVRS